MRGTFATILALFAAALVGEASAFASPALGRRSAVGPLRSQLGMLAKKAAKVDIREEKGYWQGEWVCADCGFIYAPSERVPFEEQPRGFVCPQCAGPRRRFVKKAGDVVGSLDDSALTIGTIAGLALVGGLLYYGIN